LKERCGALSEFMQVLIVTGMSGAGKTVAMQALEDLGYFCVDNLVPALLPKFVEMARQTHGNLHRIAFASDLRGGELFQPLVEIVKQMRQENQVDITMVFLEADDETLVRRYKETRRPHPYVEGSRLLDGIHAERDALAEVRGASDVILDTSTWKPTVLKQELASRFGTTTSKLPVHVISFGFKYGIPIDADMIFDVRFLPNPHYVETLRAFNGEDEPVYDYVMQWPATQEFLQRTEELVNFLIPEFTKEGKSQLVIGIGCTGGKHRSVAVAKHIATEAGKHADVFLTHRDRLREG
jgi:RNase adapter protein RapZ